MSASALSAAGITRRMFFLSFPLMANRIAKHIYTDNAFTLLEKSTYYVRDASGNVMAVYDRILDASEETSEFMLSERHIYGSSRIGMDVSTHVFGPDPYIALTETTRELGRKQYEISNHLGNVLSVITDQKLPVEVGSLIVSYSAVVVTATDYSPFGVGLYGRSWSGEYRYGFNGKESDIEIVGTGNSMNFGERVLDVRLGKWFSVDPLHRVISSVSPYISMADNPLFNIDLEGESPVPIHSDTSEGLEAENSDISGEMPTPQTWSIGRLNIHFRRGLYSGRTGRPKFGISFSWDKKKRFTQIKVITKTTITESPAIRTFSRATNEDTSLLVEVPDNGESFKVNFEPFGIPDQLIVSDPATGNVLFDSGNTNKDQEFVIPPGVESISIDIKSNATENSTYKVEILPTNKIKTVIVDTIIKRPGQRKVRSTTIEGPTEVNGDEQSGRSRTVEKSKISE
jgi:RHS repeat-associated protein